MNDVIEALLRFRSICDDFGVARDQIKMVATEATRTASNSDQFLGLIQDKTGIKVDMLSKEEEGRMGTLGIVSSFEQCEGLLMDLGGGSVQMTWLESSQGEIKGNHRGFVSLPYGAAALMQRSRQLKTSEEKNHFQQGITNEIARAFEYLDIHETMRKHADSENGLHIFLSGGGFRGWGYVLMSAHRVQPYPIPLINGFSVKGLEFLPANVFQLSQLDSSTFRISSRRVSQVPAITCLISSISSVLSALLDRAHIHFAQGGVREGWLFSLLPRSIRASSPLVTATSPYAALSANSMVYRVQSALALDSSSKPKWRFSNPDSLLTSAVNLMYVHASCPKDIRASSALHCTTTGLLAEVHGITHADRALLSLILFERWRGDLPPIDVPFHSGLQEIVGPSSSFLAAYAGRVLRGLGDVFPAGKVRDDALRIASVWEMVEDAKQHDEAVLRLEMHAESSILNSVERWGLDLERLGKKKHWVSNSRGSGNSCGFKIVCKVRNRSTISNAT